MPTRTVTDGTRTPDLDIVEAARVRDDDLRAFLTIARTDPADIGERQVFARVDGGTRVALRHGESLTDQLRPGAHTLRVHNTLMWKTVKFAIEPGEHLECQIVNSARWWTWGMAGVLGAAPLFLTVRLRSRW